MIKITDKSKCCGCSSCVNVCPKQCISMHKDEEGFLYPRVNEDSCIDCGLCEKSCPFNKTDKLRANKPESYAVKIKDEKTRENSSSGGIFSALADRVLSENGLVYGAAFAEDKKSVHHIRISSKEEMPLLRTSKYLQSEMNDTYKKIKLDLDSGKKVLFSGVPCQINGLKLFLRKEYENLICTEVICHGVPSPALWKIYVEHLEQKYNAKIKEVNFRSKKYGCNPYGVNVEGENIKQYKSVNDDPYMKMFLRNYCLRPSCYDCNAKKQESMADLTIADFWGINNVVPDFNDNAGVSLVLLQSEKGKNLFDEVKDETYYEAVDFDKGIEGNPSYSKSVQRPPERDSFFDDMNLLTFDKLSKKYVSDSLKTKLKRAVKKSFAWKLVRKIVYHR